MFPKLFHNNRVHLWSGDCLERMAELPADSFDACVTDPPYELGFMGRAWDRTQIAHRPETWAAVLRVLKPGAYLVAFHAPKNWHRLAVAIEDAGFEIRDTLLWLFGSGFPKSRDVSKAIDRAAGAARAIVGRNPNWRDPILNTEHHARWNNASFSGDVTAPSTNDAREWAGFGTALKPAYEPIVLARKPLSEGTIVANVLKWGTGAINVDGCRVGTSVETWPKSRSYAPNQKQPGGIGRTEATGDAPPGRWPANVTHDGSEDVVSGFPDQSSGNPNKIDGGSGGIWSDGTGKPAGAVYGDSGSAARFFYTAKADADDRIGSKHPTVKPLDLMQWLVRLITPQRGHILDCFAGTGTTAEAALREGFSCTLIERDPASIVDIERRMKHVFDGSVGRSVAMARLKPETRDPAPLLDLMNAAE